MQVLTELASVVEVARLQANKTTKYVPEPKRFLKAGQTEQGKKCLGLGDRGESQGFRRGPGVRAFEMRPDIILHSRLSKRIVLFELTVLWESRIEQQHGIELAK